MCHTYFISVIFHSKVLSSKKSRRTIFFNLTILLLVESFPAPSGRSTTYISYITFSFILLRTPAQFTDSLSKEESVAMLLKSTFVDGKTDTKAWSMPSPLVHASVMENRRRWHRPCCARTLQTASSTSEWKSCDLFFDIFTIRCLDSTIYLHLTVATENMFQCCQTNLVVVHVRWEHNSFLSPRNSIQDAFATIHAYL